MKTLTIVKPHLASDFLPLIDHCNAGELTNINFNGGIAEIYRAYKTDKRANIRYRIENGDMWQICTNKDGNIESHMSYKDELLARERKQ